MGKLNKYLNNNTEVGFMPISYNGTAKAGFVPYVAAATAANRYPFSFMPQN